MTEHAYVSVPSPFSSAFPCSYEYLGVHREEDGVIFRVHVSDADAVSLVGDFCDWQNGIPMTRVTADGVFALRLTLGDLRNGQCYKYRVWRGENSELLSDPYAIACEIPPRDASLVYIDPPYSWRDAGWMRYRERYGAERWERPMHVYRLDPLLWTTGADQKPLSYEALARELSPYVKQMGYTHVQLAAIAQWCDADAALGYAPNPRMGTPKQLKEFVDSMHEAGIGVLLEWTAPTGERALSSAAYWLSEYHVDGLCVSFSRLSSNAEQIRRWNRMLAEAFPSVWRILCHGETESASGLGFDCVWHTAWRSDALAYIETDPLHRKYGHDKLSQSLLRKDAESQLLPLPDHALSHAAGDRWQRFANLRLLMAYHITHRGKKLSSMGDEIGSETSDERMAWERLTDDAHARLQLYAAQLNQFYLAHPPLWQAEDAAEHTTLSTDCAEESVLAFSRRDRQGNALTVVLNATPMVRQAYSVCVPEQGRYAEIFNSDAARFGGSGVGNPVACMSEAEEGTARHVLRLTLPPLGAVILQRVADTEE